jgi:hypothetical protein
VSFLRRAALATLVAAAACNAAAGLDGLEFGSGGNTATGSGGEAEGGRQQTPSQSIGTPCSDNIDCASGNCVDDVCCDQGCVGDCVSCDQLNLFGTCTPHTGSDPEGDCEADEVCGADGECTRFEGGGCTSDDMCASGFCTDGVCCNERCDGACESCVKAQTGVIDGICAGSAGTASECPAGCIAKAQCCGDGLPVTARACPPQCTSCDGTTCTIDCGALGCAGANVVCPAGWDCVVACTTLHACQDAAIDCPADHRCDVLCGGAIGDRHECERSLITCTNGPCSVLCNGSDLPCREATVQCGSNSCDVTCDGGEPTVACGASCACQACP